MIAALNTGMHDLLDDDNASCCVGRPRIGGRRAASMEGWGESDVDEIVAALEHAYEDRAAPAPSACGPRWLLANGRTWQAHARVEAWLLSL